jgi:NADPH:quinone reductase-like Zn-dependent oxidoreductase
MDAVTVADYGTNPHLTDLPLPEPGPEEILVRMHAAGLNPFDWKAADGALQGQVPHRFPLTLGSDGSGVIEQVGAAVTRWRPGQRVYGQFMDLPQGRGSYSQYALAGPDRPLAALPDGLDHVTAAALPTAGMTAYHLVDTGKIDTGQTVLVNGATGGVGQFAVQFAAARGARVLATGGPDMAGHLRDLGATEIIDHTPRPTAGTVATAHPGGIDAIIDLVSGPADLNTLTAVLAPGGIILSALGAADPEALATRGLQGVNLVMAPSADLLAHLAELATDLRLRVRIDAEVPLRDAPAAIAKARTGHARGKTVLIP